MISAPVRCCPTLADYFFDLLLAGTVPSSRSLRRDPLSSEVVASPLKLAAVSMMSSISSASSESVVIFNTGATGARRRVSTVVNNTKQ